jgi:hypothetical protein
MTVQRCSPPMNAPTSQPCRQPGTGSTRKPQDTVRPKSSLRAPRIRPLHIPIPGQTRPGRGARRFPLPAFHKSALRSLRPPPRTSIGKPTTGALRERAPPRRPSWPTSPGNMHATSPTHISCERGRAPMIECTDIADERYLTEVSVSVVHTFGGRVSPAEPFTRSEPPMAR